MSDPRGNQRRNDRGSVMVVAALAMVALLLFAALAIDVGFIWSSRTQSQNVGDSAALAAAGNMIANAGLTVTKGAAVTAGTAWAAKNSTVANTSVTLQPTDFKFGHWDFATRTFNDSVDQTDPRQVNAVSVDVRMDGTDNRRSPGLLSRLFETSDGSRPYMDGFAVKNTSIAYLGYAGSFPDGFCMPIAIDSCELSGNGGCGEDFCARSQQPPASGCALLEAERPQNDTDGLMCGEFSNTEDQNMCFTALDGESPSINGPKLQAIVDRCGGSDVTVEDAIYIDNGDKTSTVDYIRDKFYGCDKNGNNVTPKGSYEPEYDPDTDPSTNYPNSWVVKLPVVECQDETHCAGGDPARVVGGVCFEIREVIAPAAGKKCTNAVKTGSSRWIKGRPLCPHSTNPKVVELYKKHCLREGEELPPSTSDGCDFGFRATRPLLVD